MAQTQHELDDLIKKMIEDLQRDLEASIFGMMPPHERGLRILLAKLKLKSVKRGLEMESLESTLGQVTFNNKKLKLWPS